MAGELPVIAISALTARLAKIRYRVSGFVRNICSAFKPVYQGPVVPLAGNGMMRAVREPGFMGMAE